MAEELEKLGFCPAKDKCIKRSPSPKLSLYLGSPGFYVVDRSGGITVMPFQILDSDSGHFFALYGLSVQVFDLMVANAKRKRREDSGKTRKPSGSAPCD